MMTPGNAPFSTVLCFCLFLFARPAHGLESVAGGWEKLALSGIDGHTFRVSSELAAPEGNELGRYGGHLLFDEKPETCWAEGKPGPGIGEGITSRIEPGLEAIRIYNGYQKSGSTFAGNDRVQTLAVSILFGVHLGGDSTELFDYYQVQRYPGVSRLRLEDSQGRQEFSLNLNWKDLETWRATVLKEAPSEQERHSPHSDFFLQLTIESVYPGDKFQDACLSEIAFRYPPASGPKILKVYPDQSEHALLFDTPEKNGQVLVTDPESIFQILAVSGDNLWCLVIRMPAQAEGRVQTFHELYDVSGGRFFSPADIAPDAGDFVGFREAEKGEVFLRYLDNKTGAEAEVSLQKKFQPRE